MFKHVISLGDIWKVHMICRGLLQKQFCTAGSKVLLLLFEIFHYYYSLVLHLAPYECLLEAGQDCWILVWDLFPCYIFLMFLSKIAIHALALSLGQKGFLFFPSSTELYIQKPVSQQSTGSASADVILKPNRIAGTGVPIWMPLSHCAKVRPKILSSWLQVPLRMKYIEKACMRTELDTS